MQADLIHFLQFTGPDLAALARDLDSLEQSVDDDNKGVSTNMDDTGQRPRRMESSA